jgi:predicted ester cyclase
MTAAATVEARSQSQFFREIFTILNRHDPSALFPYWDENIVEEFPTGTVHGRQALVDYFSSLFAAIPDFHIEPKAMAAEGDKVFVRWHATGTFTGAPWMGLDPTGSPLEIDGIDCFTVRDGRIVHNFVVYDQLAFARQLGMMPPMGSPLDRGMIAAFNVKTRIGKVLGG